MQLYFIKSISTQFALLMVLQVELYMFQIAWQRMYYCSVIYLTCQISVIVSAEQYLQKESPEDKKRREESACLLGEYETQF